MEERRIQFMLANRGDVDIVLTNVYENNKFPDFRVYLDSYENDSNCG